MFDVIVISDQVHSVKPHPEIFLETLRRLGVTAEESLFIDDLQVNIDGVKKVHRWDSVSVDRSTRLSLGEVSGCCASAILVCMNIIAIVVAATAAFIIAFLWNGPVFGKLAQRLSGVSNPPAPKMSQMVLNYFVFLITASIMSMVFWIAFYSAIMGDRSWFRGAVLAMWLWFGFNVTATAIDVIWHGKSWKLWLYECAASFVVFVVMGAILGSF